MHLRERGDEQRLGDEVAIGDGIERVLERPGEVERGRDRRGIERQARTRERARAERRDVGAFQAVVPAIDVSSKRPEVREQVVREQHRLRPLQVRVAGQRDLGRLPRALQQHALQLLDAQRDRAAFAPQVEPHVERDLVVAAATGVQLRTDRARDLGDAALDRGVDVLVGRRERERLARELLLDAVERGDDDAPLVLGEQTRRAPASARARANR